MTYNLIARYVRKYGELPKGTGGHFITKKYPLATSLTVHNFKEEVVDSFKGMYGVDLLHEIDIKGAAAVEIIDPKRDNGRHSLLGKMFDLFS